MSESEEQTLTETSVSGPDAWVRLYAEQHSAIEVPTPESSPRGSLTASREAGPSAPQDPDRAVRTLAA